jgi:LysR family positive regulator for ilvC
MDTQSLKIFQHLARSLHFSKTANAHHMSPSTLSRLIQRMENQMGSPLLIRDNRKVELTTSGIKLLSYADQQILEWDSLKESIDQQKMHLTGKLHIFCSVTAAYSHLPPLIDRFRQRYPHVEILLITGDPSDAISNLQSSSADQKIDIAIAAKPDKLINKLHFVEIAKIPLTIITPVFSDTIRQQLNQPDIDWNKIPFILPEHGPARKRFNDWFTTKHRGKPHIYATVSGHEALVSMVALGCGVGITPKVVVENSPVKQRVEYVSNMGKIKPFELGLCCLKKNIQQPIIKAFLGMID